MSKHEKPLQEVASTQPSDDVTENPVLRAIVGAGVWAYERRGLAYLAGLTALTVFLVVMEFVSIRGYMTARRRTTVEAELVQSSADERYDRRTEEWTTIYRYTYRFYVDDEPQEWSEQSEHVPSDTRKLHLYQDQSGTWHRFELGRGLIATVFLVVVEVVSLVSYVRRR